MVKYLGSKRTLVPAIRAAVEALGVRTACDLFAGTTRVGQALRRAGVAVHSNDLATYSEALGQAVPQDNDDRPLVQLGRPRSRRRSPFHRRHRRRGLGFRTSSDSKTRQNKKNRSHRKT